MDIYLNLYLYDKLNYPLCHYFPIFFSFLRKIYPMFILSNYKKKEPFRVSESNNLSVIESSLDNLTFKAIESNSPVQFFCIKSDFNGSFQKTDLIKAKLFTVETIFEKPIVEQENMASSYVNLVTDFGDKRSKESLNKKGMTKFTPSSSVTFNIENQILPAFHKDAQTPYECYSVSLLFEDEALDAFQSFDLSMPDACLFVRTVYRDDQKLYMTILDCLHKVLTEKLVFERALGKYGFFFKFIKDDLVRNRLPLLVKDKLMVKFYIVALMSCGFELIIDQVPRFGETQTKLISLLKMIGCTISKNGRAKLDTMPKDSFTTKKFKRN